jgi:predicted nucleotidyltransferase
VSSLEASDVLSDSVCAFSAQSRAKLRIGGCFVNIADPLASVMPSAHGAVLAVLARTSEPLSGRKVAELSNGRVGPRRAQEVLGKLTHEGVVSCEHRPPAKLYRLNREHVAATGILALAEMRSTLLKRMRDELSAWEVPPVAACLFGSASRGDAGSGSDIDLLLVRDVDAPSEAESAWHDQVDQLVDHVQRWSGNACEVLELTRAELRTAVARDDRLIAELSRDAINLTGADVRSLIGRRPTR